MLDEQPENLAGLPQLLPRIDRLGDLRTDPEHPDHTAIAGFQRIFPVVDPPMRSVRHLHTLHLMRASPLPQNLVVSPEKRVRQRLGIHVIGRLSSEIDARFRILRQGSHLLRRAHVYLILILQVHGIVRVIHQRAKTVRDRFQRRAHGRASTRQMQLEDGLPCRLPFLREVRPDRPNSTVRVPDAQAHAPAWLG